jgi:hypothetical protein
MLMVESVKGLACFKEKPPDRSRESYLARDYLNGLKKLLLVLRRRKDL